MMRLRFKWKRAGWAGALTLLFAATSVGSQLTAQEQMTQANTYLSKMEAAIASVRKLKDKAKGKGNVIKLNCVKDKLKKIQGHAGNSKGYFAELRGALQKQDTEGARHHFSMLTEAYQKVVVLQQDAEACVGEELSYVGKTTVQTEKSDDLPTQDQTKTDPGSVGDVELPPIASPVK